MSQGSKKKYGKKLRTTFKQYYDTLNANEKIYLELALKGNEEQFLRELNDNVKTMFESKIYPETEEGQNKKLEDAHDTMSDAIFLLKKSAEELEKNKLLSENQKATLTMIKDNLELALYEDPYQIKFKPKKPYTLKDWTPEGKPEITLQSLEDEYNALIQEYQYTEPILRAVEDMNKNRAGSYEDFINELKEENLNKMADKNLRKIIEQLQTINPKLKGKKLTKAKKIENIRNAMTKDILKTYFKDKSQVIKDIEGLEQVEQEAEVEAELYATPEEAQAKAMKGFKTRQQQRKIQQAFKTDKEGNLIYSEATKEKKPVSTVEAVDALNKILSSQMELDASKEAFKTVKENKSFAGFTSPNKMGMLNTERKKFKPSTETALKALTNSAMMEDIGHLYKVVYGTGHKKTITLDNFNSLVDDINKLDRVTNAEQLEEVYNILDTMNNKQYQANLAFSNELSQETAKPASISPFGEIVKTKPVKLEDVRPPPIQQYQEVKKALKEAEKAYDIQEVEGFEDLGEQQKALKNIQTLQDTLRKLQPEAKKEQQKKKKQETLRTQGEKATGAFRPHFKNVTEKFIEEELNKTPQEVLKERSNWALFDVPDSYTGTGNIHDNPLLKQIERQENILSRGLNFDCWQESYQLHEGIFERKDFWHSGRPVQTSEQRKQGIKDNKFKEEEEAYLQFFNSGDNGLFPQQQTRKEHNDFKNIYQKPSRFIGGSQIPKFQDTNNQGIKYTDNEWVNNLNLFINP